MDKKTTETFEKKFKKSVKEFDVLATYITSIEYHINGRAAGNEAEAVMDFFINKKLKMGSQNLGKQLGVNYDEDLVVATTAKKLQAWETTFIDKETFRVKQGMKVNFDGVLGISLKYSSSLQKVQVSADLSLRKELNRIIKNRKLTTIKKHKKVIGKIMKLKPMKELFELYTITILFDRVNNKYCILKNDLAKVLPKTTEIIFNRFKADGVTELAHPEYIFMYKDTEICRVQDGTEGSTNGWYRGIWVNMNNSTIGYKPVIDWREYDSFDDDDRFARFEKLYK